MNFHVGDKVRVGTRVGTITDVGKSSSRSRQPRVAVRVVCPWELVRTRDR